MIELEVFFNLFFLAWFGREKARDGFFFSEGDSVQTLIDKKPKLQKLG